MDIKSGIAGIIAGLGVGVILGGVIAKKRFDSQYDEIMQDIYNQCYREAKEDLEKDHEKHLKLVKSYEKPDLHIVHDTLIGEDSDDILDANEEDTSQHDADIFEAEMIKDISNTHPIEFITSEHLGEDKNYNCIQVFYYLSDGIFADEDDQILSDEELEAMFQNHRSAVVRQLRAEKEVYLRNNVLETDYEFCRLDASYNDIAFETDKERERRITKRKIRD